MMRKEVKQYLFSPHQHTLLRSTARERIKEFLFVSMYNLLLHRCQEQSFYTSEGLAIHSVIPHHLLCGPGLSLDTQR